MSSGTCCSQSPLTEQSKEQIAEVTGLLSGNLDKVVQHGKRADSIVKNMLLHSRAGSGEHRLVDINAIVEESLTWPITARGPRSRSSISRWRGHWIRLPARSTFSRRRSRACFSISSPTAFMRR